MLKFCNASLRTRALGLVVASLLGLAASASHALPNDDADAVSKLLADRGLLMAAPATGEPISPSNGINAQPAPPVVLKAGLMTQVRDRASDMVLNAMNFLGVPYRRGGGTESTGFDCSGFTRHIFERSLGLVLPRRADEQANAKGMIDIRRDDLRPGDLVFFNTLRRTFSHVGIYVGDGKFIHSPSAGGKVRVEDMRIGYWTARFTGARRVEAAIDSSSLGSR